MVAANLKAPQSIAVINHLLVLFVPVVLVTLNKDIRNIVKIPVNYPTGPTSFLGFGGCTVAVGYSPQFLCVKQTWDG